jgi:hypothetical protein
MLGPLDWGHARRLESNYLYDNMMYQSTIIEQHVTLEM